MGFLIPTQKAVAGLKWGRPPALEFGIHPSQGQGGGPTQTLSVSNCT